MLLTKWLTFNYCSVSLIKTKVAKTAKGNLLVSVWHKLGVGDFWGLSEKYQPVAIGYQFSSKNLLNIHNGLEMTVIWMVLLIIRIRNVTFWIYAFAGFSVKFRRNFSKYLLPSPIKPLELLWMGWSILRAVKVHRAFVCLHKGRNFVTWWCGLLTMLELKQATSRLFTYNTN